MILLIGSRYKLGDKLMSVIDNGIGLELVNSLINCFFISTIILFF